MRKLVWILVVVVVAWIATVFAVPKIIMPLVASGYSECESNDDADQERCSERIFSRVGQTGDLFGAATSLFSALGLFAVAYSVWNESRSARTAKKPLVLCTLGEEAIDLALPDFDHKSLRMSIDAEVKNLGEPALNVCLSASISANGVNIPFKKSHLEVPLATSGEEDIDLKLVLQNDDFTAFLNSLIRSGGSTELHVQLTYSSLERVSWVTKVIYILECDTHARNLLAALQGNSREQFDAHWANGAIAPIEASVKPGSWSHDPVEIS